VKTVILKAKGVCFFHKTPLLIDIQYYENIILNLELYVLTAHTPTNTT